MQTPAITRRAALLGAVCTLGGCGTLTSLNAAAAPLDTYDLISVSGSSKGRRTSRTVLIARPQASAALATDRIMIRPEASSVAYLPDARWSDELPLVLQSLLVRSISDTNRVGYVGRNDAGPVPDKALLVRIDAFEVTVGQGDTFEALVDIDLTVLNDRDQRVIATRSFMQSAAAENEDPVTIVAAFQRVMTVVLPQMADWTIQHL